MSLVLPTLIFAVLLLSLNLNKNCRTHKSLLWSEVKWYFRSKCS